MDIQCTPASILGIITIIAVLCLIFRRFGLEKVRSFYVWIGVLAVLGGAWAFLFPLAINADFSKTGDGAALRQTLIYTTGGLLGVITLGETRHKNDQEHMRQAHSERRSRYATAIEQLAVEKAPIRLGGVYTLVKLVDDWLADKKTLPNEKERREEGQVIVNSLCAYIRSPFLLAERAGQLDKPYTKDLQKDFGGDKEKFDADKRAFARDKAALEEERQVRQSIIEEIHKRLQYFGTLGSWSKLDYDFSNAHFFYPIDFVYSYFGAFSNFSGATFTQDADFSKTIFTEGDPFSGATFLQDANFSRAAFIRDANFSWARFTKKANFPWAEFTKKANFSWAEFTKKANFSKARFTKKANFSKAEFTEDTDFSGVEFTGDANFSGATFEEKPIFERALGDKTCKARFSCKADPEDYNFEVSHNSRYKIETKEKEYNGAKFIIPKGAELFDPDEPSEQDNNDGN